MKEKKVKIINLCLVATVVVKVLTAAFSLFTLLQYQQSILQYKSTYPELGSSFGAFETLGVSLMWLTASLVLTYYVIKDFKQEKAWAWIGAIVVLIISAPSFALPASVIGLIALFDESVRNDYLKKLQEMV